MYKIIFKVLGLNIEKHCHKRYIFSSLKILISKTHGLATFSFIVVKHNLFDNIGPSKTELFIPNWNYINNRVS